jgi:hypothetical protein
MARTRLSFRNRILLLPGTAAMAFIVLGAVNLTYTSRVAGLDRGDFRALQAARDMTDAFERTQRAFQDAAVASDRELAAAAVTHRTAYDEGVRRLAEARGPERAAVLKKMFTEYYGVAAALTDALLIGTGAAPEVDKMQQMAESTARLRDELHAETATHEKGMETSLNEARGAVAMSTRLNLALAAVSMLLILLLSISTVRGVVKTLGDASSFISASSAEILALARQTEVNASDEAAFVEETRKAMEGLVESADEIAGRAGEVLGKAERSSDASRLVAERISQLNAQALKITDVSEVIRAIADKSDIIALNASLEGAKAGEAGRSFSLLGGEMRRLAETVTAAVRQIKGLTNDIREMSQAAVLATDQGAKLATETSQTSKQISMITSQQRTATEQIKESMKEIQQFTQQALNGAKQARSTADDLVRSTAELNGLLSGGNGSAPVAHASGEQRQEA